MSLKRIILEMGTGNDLYGEDYTKAACRAVQDALHHSSLSLFSTLDLDRDAMQVEITVGVQQPESVDCRQVAAQIPYGSVQVNVELGGLDVADAQASSKSVIAAVAIAARVELPDEKFVLKN